MFYFRESELVLTPEQYVEEILSVENFKDVLAKTQQQVLNCKQRMKGGNYPKILFLGTGSCIPNKTRNVSGILVQVR